MPADLQLSDVHAGYGEAAILHGVSGRCPAGSLTCILGPNGAGKTTLLRVISGVLRTQRGTIMLDSTPLSKLTPQQRACRISLVPQLSADGVALRVEELVTLGRYPHYSGLAGPGVEDRAAATGALELLGLAGFARRRVASLSSGEWRRVLLAQGLAQGATVLLLDEPTAFLDPPARHSLLVLLRRLAHEQQLIVVAVMHEPLLALQFANHALLLSAGRTLDCGPAAAVLTRANLTALYGGSPDWIPSYGGLT
jgi:iron complex transport system ATP-binding protein